jgi:hypothetical protein
MPTRSNELGNPRDENLSVSLRPGYVDLMHVHFLALLESKGARFGIKPICLLIRMVATPTMDFRQLSVYEHPPHVSRWHTWIAR